jgi:hypothetical protein
VRILSTRRRGRWRGVVPDVVSADRDLGARVDAVDLPNGRRSVVPRARASLTAAPPVRWCRSSAVCARGCRSDSPRGR